jgi:hypothetical protein
MKLYYCLLLVSMSGLTACGIDSKSTSKDKSEPERLTSADAAASKTKNRPKDRAEPTPELPTNMDAGMPPEPCYPDQGKGDQPLPPCDNPSKDPEYPQQSDSPNQGDWDDPGQSKDSSY